MVIDIGRSEKMGANTTMNSKLHIELGLEFSGLHQRRLRLRGSTVLVKKYVVHMKQP